MFSNKNIDKLFQEKFKNFEQQPNPDLWNGIESKLNASQQKKESYFFIKTISVLAVLGLLTATSFWYINSTEKTNNVENVVTQKRGINNSINTSNNNKIIHNNPEVKNTTNTLKKTTKTAHSKNAIFKKITNQKRNLIALNKKDSYTKIVTNYESNNTIFNTTTEQSTTSTPIITKDIKRYLNKNIKPFNLPKLQIIDTKIELQDASLMNLQAYLTHTASTDFDAKEIANKWQVGPSVSPIYFGSLTKGSPIDASIANSEKAGSVSYSYGMKVAYKLTNKWSLQSGINNLDLSYRTRDIKAVSQQVSYNMPPSNINTEISSNNPTTNNQITIIPKETNGSVSPYFGTATIIPGDIKQDLSYTEIPLELKYNLLGKNLQLQLTGGFSTLFLQKNKITLENNINSLELGEASNLNDLNFTANLGLDVDFKVSNNWYMNFTPSFKYHLNTFSHSSGGFKPYSLGFYTGMNYKF
ncbi:MAG: hypothetical protein V3U80_02595 [Flavobacteriaceae bacterium]